MSLDFNFLKSPGPYGQTNNEKEKAENNYLVLLHMASCSSLSTDKPLYCKWLY